MEGAILRRWHGIAPEMEQPPLDHHFLALHLLGPKRIERSSGRASVTVDADCDSVSFTPAGRGYSWHTRGPIGFAHLYLSPHLLDRVILEDFGRDPRSIDLKDRIGGRSALLRALIGGIVNELESPSAASRLVLSSLLNTAVVQLLVESSTVGEGGSTTPLMMSPARLQRVIDYIDANLASDIELGDLASVAGSSRFHFSRAFRAATGVPPYRFVIHRRIEKAKALLGAGEMSVLEVATTCGFHSRSQFAAMFRRVLGMTPLGFRRHR